VTPWPTTATAGAGGRLGSHLGPGREERRDPRLGRVAGVDHDLVLELERFAGSEAQSRVVEPVEGRGGEEAVVAGDPLRRVPPVPRAVEDRDAFAQAEACSRDVAPGSARLEGSLLAEGAGGVPEDAARPGRQLGGEAGREERVVGSLDPDLGLWDENDPEEEDPELRGRRLDADRAPVDQDRSRAGLRDMSFLFGVRVTRPAANGGAAGLSLGTGCSAAERANYRRAPG
jgi:hypothetical protein